jgi:hypothetical protein
MMKSDYESVIFLDIEGVIVTHKTIILNTDLASGFRYHGGRLHWEKFIDKTALGLVGKLAMDYDATIVVSSTLRGMPHTTAGLLFALEAQFPSSGAESYLSKEHTEFLGSREKDIMAFVEKHSVERYVILDDADFEHPHLVHVNPLDGLSYDNYQAARHFLVKPPAEVNPDIIFL